MRSHRMFNLPAVSLLRVLLLVFGAQVLAFGAAPARASEVPPCSLVTIDDLDGDAHGDRLVLHCPLPGGPDDRVYVYDRDGDLRGGASWEVAADFEADLWAFDVGGDEAAQLIMAFRRDGEQLVAELFDDQTGDGAVAVQRDGKQVAIVESPYPTVRVTVEDGWWTRGTLVNMNLTIEVDGMVDAVFDIRGKLSDILRTDGRIDIAAQIRDRNGNGLPEADQRTIFFDSPPPPISNLIPRSYLMVNVEDDEKGLQPLFGWPYLGPLTYGYLTSTSSLTGQPPIQIDWVQARIIAVGEFVTSRANDGQWFTYSFNPFNSEEVNSPNFEAPFAWYDLAADKDQQPELAVRFAYFSANDKWMLGGRLNQAVNVVRYSWDQDNDNHWDYKLDLSGSHTITSVVQVDDIELIMIPYENLPATVVGMTWSGATFVAAPPQTTGEGIYVWDTPEWLTKGYFAGKSDNVTPPSQADDTYASIPAGFRGEYSFALLDQARLYISPVDKQLHLQRADQGLWNLGQGVSGSSDRQIVYGNRDQDRWMDTWEYFEAETLVRWLKQIGEQLIYVDEATGTVVLKTPNMMPAPIEVMPPHTHEQWAAMRNLLEHHRPSFASSDFLAMLRQYSGPEHRIDGASLRDLRQTQAGFRAVLTLKPGFRVSGGIDVLRGLEQGEYLLEYDGSWQVTPLTPPQIRLDTASPNTAYTEPPTALLPNQLAVTLHNDGLEDSLPLTVTLRLSGPGGLTEILSPQQARALAGEPTVVRFAWVPASAGEWTYKVEINGAAPGVEVTDTILVASNQSGDPVELLGAFGTIPPLVVLGLLGLCAMCAVAFCLTLRPQAGETGPERRRDRG